LRRTPLADRHAALGAKTADFGGWEMPIEYAGGGVVAEHTAVRERVGIFDVSHMGKLAARGPGAVAVLDRLLTNDLNRIGSGQAQYSLLCNDSGGVVDDLIVYRRTDQDVLVIPNAANAAKVAALVRAAAARDDDVEIADEHDARGIVAVQGPRSAQLLDILGLPSSQDYMAFADATWRGEPVVVCRTGYTGEHGYELVAPSGLLGALWDELLDRGAGLGIAPCGLGARDTLRTEMGYPLHGQDLSPAITVVQARLGWAVGWSKPEFAGRGALLAERAAGPTRLLWGLRFVDRGIPRPHMAVTVDGVAVGEVTSGTFSPTLRTGIALALVSSSVAEGDTVVVDVRGRPAQATVVRPPFVPAATR